jgi:hypothetical protein
VLKDDDCGLRKKIPGLKPLVFATFFAGLKPCAPSEKQRLTFSAAGEALPLSKTAFFNSLSKLMSFAIARRGKQESPIFAAECDDRALVLRCSVAGDWLI